MSEEEEVDVLDTDVDDILDMEIDDLEDLPEFKPFPPGAHRFYLSLERKEVNDHDSIEAKLVAIETLELDNSADEPLKEGDETSILFMLDNEFGRGKFKLLAATLAEFAGTKKLREIVEITKNLECIGATSVRKDKNDKDRLYTNIKELKVM